MRKRMADMAKQLEENDAAELAGQEEVAAAEVEHLQKRQAIAVPQSATLLQAVGMKRMGAVLAGFRDTVNKPSFLKEATPQHFQTMVEALFSAFNGLQHPRVACGGSGAPGPTSAPEAGARPEHFRIDDQASPAAGAATQLAREIPAPTEMDLTGPGC